MLAYAFTTLEAKDYCAVSSEPFEHAADLYAEILIQGITAQLKRGIIRTYEGQTGELPCVRGKILMEETQRLQSLQRGRVVCRYSDFTVDNDFNRMLCATAAVLLHADITSTRKKKLRYLLSFFPNVSRLHPFELNRRPRFNSQTQSYRLLVGICNLILDEELQGTQEGKHRLLSFDSEKHLNKLYERFLLAYFRHHFPQLNVAAQRIRWQLTAGNDYMLPSMLTDITISNGKRTLIIDAKYYSRILRDYHGHKSHQSHNLYQILTYVQQEAAQHDFEHDVSGMLLYAGTDEEGVSSKEFVTLGKRICINTLNLDRGFDDIRKDLNGIISYFFDMQPQF